MSSFLPDDIAPPGERSAMSEEARTMQTIDTTPARAPEDAPALVKKIGKTTYKVRVHFSDTSTETMSDKSSVCLRTRYSRCKTQRAGNLQTGFRPFPCQEKRRRGQSSTPSLSRNCATVMHFGCSISRLKKSLSPVRIISTSDTIAAFKIGWSFASRISFSAWSTAGINS